MYFRINSYNPVRKNLIYICKEISIPVAVATKVLATSKLSLIHLPGLIALFPFIHVPYIFCCQIFI